MKKLLIAGNCLFFCIAAVLGVLLYASETRERSGQGEEAVRTMEPTSPPAPAQTAPVQTSGPSAEAGLHTPASPLAFTDGYQIDLEENTFLFQKTIHPDPQKDVALVLAIDGVLDEHQYFLLAQKLRILDAKTGKEWRSFSLSYCDMPLYFTTLPMTDDIYGGLIIGDLNFDGYADFRISADDGVAYLYWTWNAEKEQFDENAELEALKLRYPEFDAEKQTILSRYADSASDSEERTYRYIGGKPRLVKWVRYRPDFYYNLQIMTSVELQDASLIVTEEYIEE